MKVKNNTIKKLLEKYKEISLLGEISAILGWDLSVNLPHKGVEDRATQSAYLAKLISEKWLEKDFKKLLRLAERINNLKIEERAVVRNLKQGSKFYHNVPKKVVVEFEETSNKAYVAWVEARKNNNFSEFAPHLFKMVELNRKIAGYYGYKDNLYDALLDMHEQGLTTKDVKNMFDNLVPELITLIGRIKKSKLYGTDNKYKKIFDVEKQKQLCNFILQRMGYDFEKGRMDISPHPFTSELGTYDVRITNRYNRKDFRESLMVAMHEGGHALYEQGINRTYKNTPLAGGVSLGIHESQSRFWENVIGRSRSFADFLAPILKDYFGSNSGKLDKNVLYKLLNKVKPSFIRTEADEVTYNLHIAIRFEIEEALINKKIKVSDVPKIWNEKSKKYLGIIPDRDANGVLQDVHWSQGLMGYFPTYTLGNLYSAQFADKMRKDLDVDKLMEKGNLGSILFWLRKNIHRYGSLYLPKDLVKRVTGENLDIKYFIEYLEKKYSKLYNLTLH